MSKLYFRYGAMNSGKSTAILQVAHNYEEKGMKILLIKPSIDTKGDRNIVSRLGVEKEVDILLTPNDTILNSMSEQLSSVFKPSAIIVDEAQFLMPLQVDELYEITKIYDIPVLCYGLRCDFQMRGFPGATRLLEISDDIEELKTICKCGKKATQNIRLINGNPVFDGKQIEIDNQDNIQYESVCGGCYLKLKRK
ncbi:MAG: thymidine kinase [Bacilli bacterium]|nr:thymidine kinase [Bacilli bacterium]MBR4004000.1 thymidine kinase [Clostridia bacterium]